MSKGNQLAKVHKVSDADLEARGIAPGSEDAIAIRQSVDEGMEIDEALGGLAVQSSAEVAAPKVEAPQQVNAAPATAQAKEGGYLAGHGAASEIAISYREGFAHGLKDGVQEGQDAIATFQSECINSLGAAFGPRG